MLKNRFTALFALIAAIVTLGVSCIQVQPAPATGSISNERYGRISGNYTANLGCSLFEADSAVRNAAKSLKLYQLSRLNETSKIEYEYKDVYESRVSVTLSKDANGLAQIVIKFAKFGNKDFSKQFIDAIDEQLRVEE